MIANMNMNNGKRLVAAVAIFAMIACCLACVVPSADAAPAEGTYASGTTPGYIAVDDVASVSFLDSEGNEWIYEKGYGNTEDITNSSLGNTDLQMSVNGTTVDITGTLKFQGADSQLKLSGAPAGYNYAFIFDLADVNENGDYNFGTSDKPVYIGYINSMNVWKPLTKNGETSTQLVYVNDDRRSTTYYISSAEMADKTAADEAVKAGTAKTVTVNWNFTLDNTIDIEDASSLATAINNSFSGGAQEITVTSDQTLSGEIILAGEGQVLNVDGATITANTKFTVPTGATINYSIVADENGKGATFTIVGGENTNIKVSDAVGTFTVTGGSAEFEGIINGSMTIGPADDSNKDGIVVFKDAIIPANVTITLREGVTYQVEGSLTVYGKILAYTNEDKVTDDVTINVNKVGDVETTMTAYPGATIGKGVSVIGNGKIDLSAAMSTVTLNDDIESDFSASQSQKVVIADTLTIKSGYKMVILGELVINEGCTVIIEDGAQLILGSEDSKIKATGMTVNGNIMVEEGGELKVTSAENVTVVGKITSSGTVDINSNVTIKTGGSISIDDSDGSIIKVVETANFTIENGGELSVAGDMNIAKISNKGTVTLNGANIVETSTISMTADGAVVDIRSMTQAAGKNLVINDVGMYLYTNDKDVEVKIGNDNRNVICFNADDTKADVGVRNITVTASLTSEEVDKDTTNYISSLILSGSITILDDTKEGDFISTNGQYLITTNCYSKDTGSTEYTIESSIEVPESLTIGRNITLSVNGGVFNVDGTVTATAEKSKIESKGQINVTGMITTDISSPIASGINAFHYEDEDYNYYTTLKTSVDNGAKDIEYLGNVSVLDSVTLPTETILTKGTNAGTITIGDEDNRDIIVTVNDGATIRGCNIDVMATLVFDVNQTGNRNNGVSSDVIIDAEPKRTYTNIYTALEDAADNSTVTIARNIFLDKDAEIRQTITLQIPASYGVYLDDGVTLTVNGTIENSGKIGNAVEGANNQPDTAKQMAGFNPYTDEANTIVNEDRAEIIVNGTIMSMTDLPYDTYFIVGAYYQMVNDKGAWYYITPVEQAAAVSNDVEKGKIEIFGENTVGDVAFTGDADQAVTVTVNGTLNAGKVTLTLATIDVDGTFSGTIASAVGSVDVVNATGFEVEDTTVGKDKAQTTYLTGTPVAADEEQDSSVTVATGTVNAGQIQIVTNDTKAAYIGSFEIAEGATLKVDGQYEEAVASINASEMTVNGTLVASDSGNVDVTTMTVRGTFTVEAENKDTGAKAGTATIGTMYVGIAMEQNKDKTISYFVDSSAAAVNADEIKTLTTMYVSAESTVAGKITEKLQYTTGFYVEDALWMTIYNKSAGMAISDAIQPGDLVNSEFSYWVDADGEKIGTDNPVNVGEAEAVYANLNYNIYTITVFADPGINAVYIDGQLMPKGYFTVVDNATGELTQVAGFQIKVAAGTHEITYKLNNYFSGEANMTVNGTAVSGNTFTTSGTTTADKNVTIYLQGIDASAPETPSTGGSDNGMGLTDYLLIILVVLIVVMAIMVAMRLMRS